MYDVKKYEEKIAKLLVGRKITSVRYADETDMKNLGFDGARPIVLQLDDGNQLIPSMDDEGNGAGALFTTYPEMDTIGVL